MHDAETRPGAPRTRRDSPGHRTDEAAEERVVLVDEQDRPLGTAGKLAAHLGEGRLHRAFSVFLFDASGRMLIQQRAAEKYHFASLWTNACCSHPRPGEPVEVAARRRVREELGLGVEPVRLFSLLYTARDPASGLIERELDHVFAGRFEAIPRPCRSEVSAVSSWEVGALMRACEQTPERFTPWFRLAMRELEERGHFDEWAVPGPPQGRSQRPASSASPWS
jgi:isopentenyl-diphosphate delta-isomerase